MTTTDKSCKIFIHDDLHPEDGAMLQALYSRSPASVEDHLEKVKKLGSGKFMSQYYVGYGHASIGDCGVTNIFMENYSVMAAKVIQDNPLYSGQEASTRYLDFSVQPMYDPYNNEGSMEILNGWMEIYNKYMPYVKDALKKQHPCSDEYKSETIWENTINARAFDIMRGFLPLGVTTLFSWTTNLRQARDKIFQLRGHPLPEIRKLAADLFTQLKGKYPNSFNGEEMSDTERYSARHAYYEKNAVDDNFLDWNKLKQSGKLDAEHIEAIESGEFVYHGDLIDIDEVNKFEKEVISSRPKGAHLPRRLAAYGTYVMYFTMDFGSYRDLQRHRNGICQIPLVDGSLGMYSWYMDEFKALLPEMYSELSGEVEAQFQKIRNLEQLLEGKSSPLLSQYLMPLGITVVCQLAYSLPQVVYVAELRSSKAVHQTLRPIAQSMAQMLESYHPNIALYVDTDEDSWSAKRGEQTIVTNSSGSLGAKLAMASS